MGPSEQVHGTCQWVCIESATRVASAPIVEAGAKDQGAGSSWLSQSLSVEEGAINEQESLPLF